ncbi:hypothetical protein EYF80_038692 [Liparis tanakae]|uniref:Uncharacterized protein n=1 Tax=Liparis tanakae TaxID=230148 RepID=A0A4Z2GDB0_9TELE|nr:hypothetical protein EYF80_038692 [Liparis tanakae]
MWHNRARPHFFLFLHLFLILFPQAIVLKFLLLLFLFFPDAFLLLLLRGSFFRGRLLFLLFFHVGLLLRWLLGFLATEDYGVEHLQDVRDVFVVKHAHDEEGADELQDGDEMKLHAPSYGISHGLTSVLHGLRQHGDDWTQCVDAQIGSYKPNGGEMEFGAQARREADPGQRIRFVGVQSDAARFVRHRDDEFLVGSQSVPLGGLQVHADEQVVEAAPHRPGQVGVLDGVEELRLVHVAAQSVSHAVVAQGAH